MNKQFNEIVDSMDKSEMDLNFEGFKYTEMLYSKLDWIKQSVVDIEEYLDIIIEVQNFIEKLQPLENK